MDRLPPELRSGCARDFHHADEAFRAGRLEATANKREMRWQNWCTYVKHLGVDPYLQHIPYPTRVRCLTGFAACTQTGFYGYGRQVQSSTVTGAITAVGQTIALACNENPTKVLGSDKFLPPLQIMLDGYMKADPPTQKKLPVEADVPKLLVEMGYGKLGSIQNQAIGDLSRIAFYYLLCIGEYTVKRQRDHTKRAKKQTVQFKLEDVTFFKTDKTGILRCLPRNAPHFLIMTAESATLKLNNQKNGWGGVCVHQEANGETFSCPVIALARQVIHIREHEGDNATLLSAFYTWMDEDTMSLGMTLARDKKWQQNCYTIHHQEEYQLIESIHILFGVGVQMPWHYQDIPTHRFKKWAGGKVQHSKSISGRSLRATPRECHHA